MSAFRNIVRGIDNALRLFSHASSNPEQRPTLVRTAVIDGLPGYISYNPEGRLQTTAVDIENGQIRAIYIVRNPDKLTHVTATKRLPGLRISVTTASPVSRRSTVRPPTSNACPC